MSRRIRIFILTLIVIIGLLLNAVGPVTIAYADGDGTTPAPTTETTPVPKTTATPVAGAPSVARVAPEGAVKRKSEAKIPLVTSGAGILQKLPPNTSVTVVDANGRAQSLTSQSAADAIATTSDPIWCPDTILMPIPGMNGCTSPFSSFDALLTFLADNQADPAYQQAGTIYVQTGNYTGGEAAIDFNNYNLSNTQNYDLTIQGGWNSTNNTVPPDATSQFSVPFTVGSSSNPWVGSLTLNNLVFNNVSNQTALTLFTQGSINLSNVEATNSQTGADLNAGGDVTINHSKFDNNKNANALVNAGGQVNISDSTFNGSNGKGLEITNNTGTVSLSSVEANNNGLFGANIQSSGDVTILNSFFNGNQSVQTVSCPTGNGGKGDDDHDEDRKGDDHHQTDDYKYTMVSSHDKSSSDDRDDDKDDDDGSGSGSCQNTTSLNGYGLQVVTAGGVTLDGVSASNNSLFGAHLEGSQVIVGPNDSTNQNVFDNNGTGVGTQPSGKGLEIVSTGDVTLNNVEANNNQLFGANIQALGGPLVNVAINNSFFNGNQSTAVVACTSGAGGDEDDDDHHGSDESQHKDDYKYVTSVKHSSGDDKDDDDNSSCNTTGASSNGYGLQVVSTGGVSLFEVTASDNSLYGAHLEGNSVAVTSAIFDNNSKGLEINNSLSNISIDAVALFDVEANNNQLFGADIQAAGNVAIGGTSLFNGNQSVSTVACQSSGDKDDDDHQDSSDSQHKDDYKFVAAVHKDSSDDKDDDDNSTCQTSGTALGYGLQVITNGSIALDGVSALSNDTFGAHLEGASIAISNSFFDNNGSSAGNLASGKGLEIISTADVTLSNVEANNNQLFGADIQAASGVAISNGFFNGNQAVNVVSCKNSDDKDDDDDHKSGDDHNSIQAVGVKQSSGDDKDDDDNTSCNTTTGAASNGYGLQVITTGPVALFNVTASNNSLFGAHLEGSDMAIGGTVSDTGALGSAFDNNGAGGLEIVASSTVSLNNTEANNNQLFGADIKAASDVYINNSFFNGNQSVNVVSCSGNSGDKDDDDHNSGGDHNGDLKLVGEKHSSDDDKDDDDTSSCSTGGATSGYGLQIVTPATITMDGVFASDNSLFGAHLEGSDTTVSNSIFDNNGAGGLEVVGAGTVTLDNVEANNNQLFGANITAPGDVMVTNSFFNGNQSANVVACTGKSNDNDDDNHHSNDDSQHKDDYKFVMAHRDSSDDKDDDDNGTSTCQTSATSLGYGLQIVTNGNITLNGVTASDNGLFGAHLEGATVAVSDGKFDNNGSGSGNTPTGSGLEIISTGTVTLNNVEANNNQLFGADIQAVGEVSVVNSVFSGNTAVMTLPSCQGSGGTDKDDDDHKSGDDSYHKDDYKFTKTDTSQTSRNSDDDEDDDDDGGSQGSQTCSSMSTYGGYGLQIVTTGPISLDGVAASNNGLNGAVLKTPADITVTNSTFDANGTNSTSSGLVITTASGQVTLGNVQATNNGLDGVNVTGSCTTVFLIDGLYQNNGGYGLSITNATLDQSGTPVFSGNGIGDIFQDPGTCVSFTVLTANNAALTRSALSGTNIQ